MEDLLKDNLVQVVDMFGCGRKLLEVFIVEEIDLICDVIDFFKIEGQWNWVIIEILYFCGLWVLEFVSLWFEDLYFLEGFICVIGKGNKECLVLVSFIVIFEVGIYFEFYWFFVLVQCGNESYVFFNCWGV